MDNTKRKQTGSVWVIPWRLFENKDSRRMSREIQILDKNTILVCSKTVINRLLESKIDLNHHFQH